MTEAEAKKRWCPFARVCLDYGDAPNLVIGPVNRDFANRSTDSMADAIETSKCIGSDCMAWRWIDAEVEFQRTGTHQPTNTGYCGLAGKP